MFMYTCTNVSIYIVIYYTNIYAYTYTYQLTVWFVENIYLCFVRRSGAEIRFSDNFFGLISPKKEFLEGRLNAERVQSLATGPCTCIYIDIHEYICIDLLKCRYKKQYIRIYVHIH